MTDIDPCAYYQVKSIYFSRSCQLLTTVGGRSPQERGLHPQERGLQTSPTKSEDDTISEAEDYDLKCAKKRQSHIRLCLWIIQLNLVK